MVEAKLSSEMAEILRFRIPPWFDPVPWFIWERLEREQMMELTKVQLRLQKSILLAQQRAINEAIRVIG